MEDLPELNLAEVHGGKSDGQRAEVLLEHTARATGPQSARELGERMNAPD